MTRFDSYHFLAVRCSFAAGIQRLLSSAMVFPAIDWLPCETFRSVCYYLWLACYSVWYMCISW